jgi:hypothetical protein
LFGDKVASENFYFSLKVGANVSNLGGVSDLSSRTGLNFGLLSTIKLNDDFYLVPEFPPISRKGAKGIPYPGSGPLPIDGPTRLCRSWNGELRPDRVAELQEDRSLLP